MGYDLKPCRPTKNAPRKPDGEIMWGRYNIWGWPVLISSLEKWGVDVSQIPHYNDGDLISAKKCREIADALEKNRMDSSVPDWVCSQGDIDWWRNCGGCRVY